MDNRAWTVLGLLIGITAGIIVCIWFIAQSQTTATEEVLFSIFLTALSSAGSWAASRYYAEYSSSKNLKFFALKAAEKVTNLSKELDRLSAFLQQELESSDHESPAEGVLAKDDRIEGAIHIIHTLKSVNDGSLSDWQGVIGEEIVARREQQREEEASLRELLERLEALNVTTSAVAVDHKDDEAARLRQQLEALKADFRILASQVGGVSVNRKRILPPLQKLKQPCPNCGFEMEYTQRPRENRAKAIKCDHCGEKFVSTYADGKFLIRSRMPVHEEVVCPSCGRTVGTELDPMPGSYTDPCCPACGVRLHVFRKTEGVGVKEAGPWLQPVTEELISRIREAMPAQPWPKGTTKEVAERLQVPQPVASKAVDVLISRGVFKPQIDGHLYVREDAQGSPNDEAGE